MNSKLLTLLGAAAFSVALAQPATAQTVVYDNGGVNGESGAVSIVWGWAASNSFTLSATTQITGVTFGAWVSPGNSVTAIDWGINDVFPPDFLSNGTASITSSTFVGTNSSGYSLYTYAFSITPETLEAGTYYLSLQNAASELGGAIYWDINFGGSAAYSNLYGQVASESFQILGIQERPGGPGDGDPQGVPEPASWLMMVAGFCLAGAALRSRRRIAVSFAA